MADLFSELSRAQSRAQPSAKQLSQLDLLIGRLEEVKDRLEKGKLSERKPWNMPDAR